MYTLARQSRGYDLSVGARQRKGRAVDALEKTRGRETDRSMGPFVSAIHTQRHAHQGTNTLGLKSSLVRATGRWNPKAVATMNADGCLYTSRKKPGLFFARVWSVARRASLPSAAREAKDNNIYDVARTSDSGRSWMQRAEGG